MPKIILRFSSLLILLFAFCILACMFMSQLSPRPNSLRLLNNLLCIKNECLASNNDADSVQWSLEDYGYIQSVLKAGENGRLHFDGYDVIFWKTVDEETTVMIQSTTSSEIILLGSLMAFYAKPCSVTFTEDSINLQFPEFYVTIKAEYDLAKPDTLHMLLSPFMPVESINLFYTNASCEIPITFATSQNIVTKWLGFRSINSYILQKSR